MAKKKEEQEIEVRRLQNNDIFTVAKMLLKVTGDAKEEITTLIKDSQAKTEEGEERTPEEEMRVGIQLATVVIEKCLTHAEKDLKKWLGDMCGMSAKEFGEAPAETSLIVMEQLIEEDLKNFFSRAFRLFRKMRKSEN